MIYFIIFISGLILGFSLLSNKYANPYKNIFVFGKKGSGKSCLMVREIIKHQKKVGYVILIFLLTFLVLDVLIQRILKNALRKNILLYVLMKPEFYLTIVISKTLIPAGHSGSKCNVTINVK